MKVLRVFNGSVASARGVLAGARIIHADGVIDSIDPPGAGADGLDLEGGWLLPGFLDLQVNGGGGVLFNADPSVEAIEAIGRAHTRFGVTGFLPTLITDEPATVAKALDAVGAAIGAGVPGVLGAHIEGPVINPARKGIHDPASIRAMDAALLALLTRPREGRLLLTLAPEMCRPSDLAALREAGVVLSIGHSDATYEQAVAAFEAGVTGVTHLFNAMSGLHHRAPGVAGAALDEEDCYCGLIVDGAHLHPAVLRIALAAKRRDRFLLVSDAMPNVGGEVSGFELNGRWIEVRDGVCHGPDGTLAGSSLDMAAAVRNVVAQAGLPVATASAMASGVPAAFLGLPDRGALAPGRRADWVWLDAGLMPRGVWIGGEAVT